MTTDIKDGCAHVNCCADLDGGVKGNSCVGANDCVDIGIIIGASLVYNIPFEYFEYHKFEYYNTILTLFSNHVLIWPEESTKSTIKIW